MNKYTANDFRHAKFATHPNGRFGARVKSEETFSWVISGSYRLISDQDMAYEGFIPADPCPHPDAFHLTHLSQLADAVRAVGHEVPAWTMIPKGTPVVLVGHTFAVHPYGYPSDQPATEGGNLYYTFDPLPEPRPEGAADLDDVIRAVAGDALTDEKVRAIADRIAREMQGEDR